MSASAKARKEQQEFFENIIENTGISSIVVEKAEGKILYANSHFCSAIAIDREDIIARSHWQDFIIEEDRERCLAAISNCGLERTVIESRAVNGSKTVDVLLIVGGLAEKEHSVVSFIDITEKNRAIREGKDGKAMFETLFRNAPEAFAVVDGTGKIIDINESFYRTFYFPSGQQITGKDITVPLLNEEDSKFRKDFKDKFGRAAEGQKVDWETWRRTFDGRFIPVHIRLIPVELESRSLYYIIYQDTSQKMEREEKLKTVCAQLSHSLEQIILTASRIIEHRDPYTAGHQLRAAELAAAIAAEMGMDKDAVQGVYFGGLLHDIGKVQIPSEILNKPSLLSDVEFALVKQHPEIGYQILEDIDFPWPIQDIVRHHHERLDGSGYPDGLKGDEISAEARIMAVADVVEAIMNHRPYRPALGLETALDAIRSGAGVLYDPQIVGICVKLFTEKGFAFKPSDN